MTGKVTKYFAKRSTNAASQQHADEENHCLRIGNCNNAALGEQTLGNDNYTNTSSNSYIDNHKNSSNLNYFRIGS